MDCSSVFQENCKQTAYVSKDEKKACDKTSVKDHNDFQLSESGLVINPKWPVIGASPDGVVSCICCGNGVLEIKCPYSHQNTHIQDAASQDSTFCLKKVDGSLRLDNSHTYYYQIQTQLFVCDVEYCDFCVCTFVEDDESKGLHFTLNVFIRMKHSGWNVFQKLNNSLNLPTSRNP